MSLKDCVVVGGLDMQQQVSAERLGWAPRLRDKCNANARARDNNALILPTPPAV